MARRCPACSGAVAICSEFAATIDGASPSISGDDDRVGLDRSAARGHGAPARAVADERDDARLAMNPRLQRQRRSAQFTRIGERVERSGAMIDEGAEIAPGTGEGGGFRRAEILDRGAAALPLLGAALGALDGGGGMQALDPGAALRLGYKTVAGDEIEDEFGDPAGEAPETLAALAPEHRLELVGIVFESWNDLSAVAPRGAPARRLGIERHDVGSRLGEM
jgi:hypothetical protein